MVDLGDKAQCCNALHMYLMFTCDFSGYLSDSAASRLIIGLLPANRYILDPESGVNLTLQAACQHITSSFNQLSREGIVVRDFSTGDPVTKLSSSAVFCVVLEVANDIFVNEALLAL